MGQKISKMTISSFTYVLEGWYVPGGTCFKEFVLKVKEYKYVPIKFKRPLGIIANF